jgi:N-acetylglucosamine kinase-like BadF-type ATPase
MTSENTTLLSIDAGQTGVRALIQSKDHLRSIQFSGLRTDLALFPQLAEIVHAALAGLGQRVDLAVGMTGLTKEQSRPDELLGMLDQNIQSLFLAHDSVTGFLGSMGFEEGTVSAVGTGVVTLSVGQAGVSRVDGWGNLIGDAGSAFWLGRAGLEAAMKSHDGRISDTSLRLMLYENFSSPEDAYMDLQQDQGRVSRIALLAQTVLEMSEHDETARVLVNRASSELALSAVTAARRSGELDRENPKFSWSGGMMQNEVLRSGFMSEVVKLVPNAVFHPPLGEPILGVSLLPKIPETSALHESVHSATRTQ